LVVGKRYTSRVAISVHQQGLIVTTSDFSPGAAKEANKPGAIPVALMNGEQLISLLIEYGIGAHKGTAYLLELGDEEEE
jgi:restriction system protein